MEARAEMEEGSMEDEMAEQEELESRVMTVLALQDTTDQRETRLQTEIESVVECPVCYVIPRQLPIPCCPAGHILCQTCRARVLHCPTCRRQLEDNTSSLAAALIEKVKHKCKYWERGCQHRALLGDLVGHEAACPERTIHCPAPNGCDEVVQLKKFHEHVVRNQCSVAIRQPTKFNLSKGWLRWDGTSLRKAEEFNLREDLAWSFFHVTKFENNFYFSAQYFASEQLFLFYVMVMGGADTAERFTARVRLVSREARVKLMFEGPVLPLDRVPATEEALMASTSCFTVHYRAMRPILSVTEVGENRNISWSVDFLAEVDLIKKPEDEICLMNQ